MKKLLLATLFFVGIFSKSVGQANKMEMVKCPKMPYNSYTGLQTGEHFIDAPKAYYASIQGRVEANTCQINVTYNGFPPAAQKAFQGAVDVWQTLLVSDVPINVEANWTNLGKNVLGSASPTNIYRNFAGAVKSNTWYCVAMAEKMAHKNLNGTDYDISANFNASFDWYTSLSGIPGKNQQDLFTIVLHELEHGLGFFTVTGISGNTGSYGYNGYPFIYDHFMVGSNGKNIIDKTAFPATVNASGNFASLAIKNQYTSGTLTFSGPLTNKADNNLPVKLYSPATYEVGSSIAHLDEVAYPRSDPNTLMTPQAGSQEVTHDPGPISRAMLADMGWRSSSILHDNFGDSEDITKSWIFNATFKGDTTLVKGSMKMFIANTGTIADAKEVPLTAVAGKTNQFSYTLPPTGKDRVLQYYFTGQDSEGRNLRTPAESFYFQFTAGADTVKPKLTFFPTRYVFAGTKDTLLAQATDNIAVDKVMFEYQVNGTTQTPIQLARTSAGSSIYRIVLDIAKLGLKGGEKIKYRVVATDSTKGKNFRASPETGFYEMPVLNALAPALTYKSDFNTQTVINDFYLDGFDVSTPTGFPNGSLNSEHPYQNGNQVFVGGDSYSDYTAVLLKPITISAKLDSAIVSFDEIAMVEPGAAGSIYGDGDFYDYVVVEGSKDGGQTWIEFSDGWDARDNPVWENAFNAAFDKNNNSTAVAKSTYARRRTINMRDNGHFKAGDKVYIRFHLFTDTFTSGWGWWIDNLYIQTAVAAVSVVTATENPINKNEVSINPNPSTTGEFNIDATFEKPASKVSVMMKNTAGQDIYNQDFDNSGTSFSQKLSVGRLPVGIYYIQVQTNDVKVVKRVGVLR